MRREITARFNSKCHECQDAIEVGEVIIWDAGNTFSSEKPVAWHKECNRRGENHQPAPIKRRTNG